jgi:hypothetical protein
MVIGPNVSHIALVTSFIVLLTVVNPRRKLKPIVLNESPVARYLQKWKKELNLALLLL